MKTIDDSGVSRSSSQNVNQTILVEHDGLMFRILIKHDHSYKNQARSQLDVMNHQREWTLLKTQNPTDFVEAMAAYEARANCFSSLITMYKSSIKKISPSISYTKPE